MAAQPAFLASLLRQKAGVADRIPVDVEHLVGEFGIVFGECPLDGCLGLYLPPPEGPGILIRADQEPDRRRFTIAHELGHFALPTHGTRGQVSCLVDDFVVAAIDSRTEREANQFAAELLMPRSHFGAAVRNRDPDFRLVRELADESRFFVSRTAAAVRTVELSRESCILVCSENGRVKWMTRSPNCRALLEVDRGDPVPVDSIASAVFGGEAPNDAAEEVAHGAWFGGVEDAEAYESTFAIPSLSQVLSLLWVVPREDD